VRRHVRFDQRLDLALDLVGEFEPVWAENLDAVVVIGVVGGRDHNADIGPQGPRQHGDARRRDRAELEHVDADRGEAGDEGGLDHVAGQPGVLADHHAVAMVAAPEDDSRRHADLHGHFRRDGPFVGAPAHAIGSEEFSCHPYCPAAGLSWTRAGLSTR